MVAVGSIVLQAAAKMFATLPSSIFLRSSDCIQLVTAHQHHFKEIYTYDKHQSQAASVLGLKAISVT
jgi:predicted nucleic acid-binding protein